MQSATSFQGDGKGKGKGAGKGRNSTPREGGGHEDGRGNGGGKGKGRNRNRNRSGRGKGSTDGGKDEDSIMIDAVSVGAHAVTAMPPDLPPMPNAPIAVGGLPPPPSGKANPLSRTSATTRAHLTSVTFASLPISAVTKRAIAEVMRYETLSAVQAQTLPVILKGSDVIAKAKTGTGKTIAFLLPTIEKLATVPGPGVRALAISPTRELASQIREEAEQLLTFHKQGPNRLSSMVVFGGTNVKSDVRALAHASPALLVATPGRLNDLLYNHGLVAAMGGLQTLIFDEADQLLEMGFRPDVTKILQALQPSGPTRQTLLFSATLPPDVQQVAKIATRPNMCQVVDTVGEEEATHAHVPQKATVTPIGVQAAELYALLTEVTGPLGVTAGCGYKVLVFFTTARMAQLYSELFSALKWAVLEMHSRKSQPHRTRVADQFREGSNLIMFSSDVSARGMDYPGVTAVIQVGMPSDKAQYIHRLGRTARAGKAGGGHLLLADFESDFLRQLSDLPIEKRQPISAQACAAVQPQLRAAFASLPELTLTCAYQAYLGFYNSYLKRLRWDKEEVVRRANQFSMEVMGLASPPPLQAKTIGKMGLKGVPGLIKAAA